MLTPSEVNGSIRVSLSSINSSAVKINKYLLCVILFRHPRPVERFDLGQVVPDFGHRIIPWKPDDLQSQDLKESAHYWKAYQSHHLWCLE